MKTPWIILALVLVILLVFGIAWSFGRRDTPAEPVVSGLPQDAAASGAPSIASPVPSAAAVSTKPVRIPPQKKSAHFETSTPAHGAVLPAPPINVVVDFNFDLAVPSAISVTKDGVEYGRGETIIDANKLSMRRAVDQNAPDGLYTVRYTACWPDRSCHDGNFNFVINRSSAGAAVDYRTASSVIIRMKDIAFVPPVIRIRPGTKVTWVNDDAVDHYVNTDSHPAHTYFPSQNSRALAQGATYATTFTQPGAYPYHCSAHAATMTGMIIVS